MNLKWATERGAELLGLRPFQASGHRSQVQVVPHEVEHVKFPFRQWDGPIGPWKEHFGKGHGQVYPLVGLTPNRSCNEVEVAKMLRKVRDYAFWFSSYNTADMPELWKPWVLSINELPLGLKDLDSAIRDKVGSRSGGIPDAVAWNDNDPLRSALFVECKGPKEKFRKSQQDWLEAAVLNGLLLSQVAVSVRPF